MKKLLWLLFAIPMMAQIHTVNNTTQLSALEAQGICIVQSWNATSGIYTSIDSTYSEGTYAFDHVYSGKQWAKLGSFANLVTGGTFTSTGAVTFSSTAEINGNITLQNDEIIANSTDGDLIFTFNDDDDSLGQLIIKSSVTGTAVAPSDHLDITFEANDGGSTNTEYAKIIATITDTTRASEDATLKFQTITNATSTLGLTLTGANATIAGTVQSTGGAVLLTGTGGSSTDSSLVFSGSSGVPVLSFYGTDGDVYTHSINTSDEMVLSGMAALDVPTSVAGIDSFWLELTVDTINITGVAAGDIFTFTEYCPDYSTPVDTVTFSYKCESGRVLVTRATAGDVSAPTYKSVGKYAYIRMK